MLNQVTRCLQSGDLFGTACAKVLSSLDLLKDLKAQCKLPDLRNSPVCKPAQARCPAWTWARLLQGGLIGPNGALSGLTQGLVQPGASYGDTDESAGSERMSRGVRIRLMAFVALSAIGITYVTASLSRRRRQVDRPQHHRHRQPARLRRRLRGQRGDLPRGQDRQGHQDDRDRAGRGPHPRPAARHEGCRSTRRWRCTTCRRWGSSTSTSSRRARTAPTPPTARGSRAMPPRCPSTRATCSSTSAASSTPSTRTACRRSSRSSG
ncbi:hypothetical protein [Nocardioides convexus]|uniref:hypothetical protein n=1 Tax=Nocardioides convexus TaxID=2712224 RepID=UPI0024189CC4|nr:hypothetical protein [Nocardioides convexus]